MSVFAYHARTHRLLEGAANSLLFYGLLNEQMGRNIFWIYLSGEENCKIKYIRKLLNGSYTMHNILCIMIHFYGRNAERERESTKNTKNVQERERCKIIYNESQKQIMTKYIM